MQEMTNMTMLPSKKVKKTSSSHIRTVRKTHASRFQQHTSGSKRNSSTPHYNHRSTHKRPLTGVTRPTGPIKIDPSINTQYVPIMMTSQQSLSKIPSTSKSNMPVWPLPGTGSSLLNSSDSPSNMSSGSGIGSVPVVHTTHHVQQQHQRPTTSSPYKKVNHQKYPNTTYNNAINRLENEIDRLLKNTPNDTVNMFRLQQKLTTYGTAASPKNGGISVHTKTKHRSSKHSSKHKHHSSNHHKRQEHEVETQKHGLIRYGGPVNVGHARTATKAPSSGRPFTRTKLKTSHKNKPVQSATEKKVPIRRIVSSASHDRKMKSTTSSSRHHVSHSDVWVTAVGQNISLSDIHVKSLLGEGAFSKVYLGSFRDTLNVKKTVPPNFQHHNLAVKILPKVSNKSAKSTSNIWEKFVLSQLDNPFIVKYFGAFTDTQNMYILMEFVIGGEILYHFESSLEGRFSLTTTRFYIGEIICAIEYLHNRDYIYRDLKPENILLDHRGHIKIVDFGFAKKLKKNDKTYTLCGSKEYVAPEVLTGQGHSHTVDFWSLGVLAYEFVTGHLPFPTQDCSPYEVLDVIYATTLTFPSWVPGPIKSFIKGLLTLAPFRRMGCSEEGFRELKEHEWYQGFDWHRCNKQTLKPPIIPRYSSPDDISNFETAKFDDDFSHF